MKHTIMISLAAATLLSAQSSHYTITDLGPVGPAGQPFAIANNGLVSGDAATGKDYHATLWYHGQKIDMSSFGFGGPNSTAFGINVRALSVGQAETATRDPYGEDFCGYGTRLICLPFISQFGFLSPLPTLGGKSGTANQINSHGDVVGMAENATRDPACPPPQQFEFKAVLWKNGQAQELPTFHGDPEAVAVGINEAGQVVGATGSCGVYSPYTLTNLVPLHAVLWQNGVATDLGSLGGSGRGVGNIAFSINNKGQIVGNSDLPGDTVGHGFLWEKGKIQDLGTLPGDVTSAALFINDSGQVVGVSLDGEGAPRATMWFNGAVEDLNDLVPSDSPLYLLFACGINAGGQIVGQAADKLTGEPHGFLLTPGKPLPGSSITPALRRLQRKSGAARF